MLWCRTNEIDEPKKKLLHRGKIENDTKFQLMDKKHGYWQSGPYQFCIKVTCSNNKASASTGNVVDDITLETQIA